MAKPRYYYLRFLAVLSALCMCVHAAQLCAAINVSGDVTPVDPSLWDNTTTVHIGQTANGTVTVDSPSGVLSRFAFIGYLSGYSGEFTVDGPGSTWTNSSRLYDGFSGTGALNITGGGVVNNDFGCLGYIADSVGTAKIDGIGSKWNNTSELYVGFYGNGTMDITGGGAVSNSSGYIGYNTDPPTSSSTGRVTVDGANSKWTNNSSLSVGLSGKGTLNISGGAAVTAPSVYINGQSLLAIDVGNGSQLNVNNGTGAITNAGTVRILAGANANLLAGPYSPISAGTWSGGGTYQPIGGTWNATDHTFAASDAILGFSGTQTTIDLKNNQRLLIDGLLGASFAPTTSDTSLNFTATAMTGQPIVDLQTLAGAGQTILGGWDIDATGGYLTNDPAYLSFDVGPDISRNDINVWHYNGIAWSPYDATDLTCNGDYASFTVTGFSGYALTVPEPGTFMLLACGLMTALVYARRRIL